MSRRLSSATIEDSDGNNTVLVAGTTVTFTRPARSRLDGPDNGSPSAPRHRHPTFIPHSWPILDRRSPGSVTKPQFKTI